MFKLSQFIGRKLRAYSDESRSRDRADPTITMTRITGTRLEYCFPLRCERISEGHISAAREAEESSGSNGFFRVEK